MRNVSFPILLAASNFCFDPACMFGMVEYVCLLNKFPQRSKQTTQLLAKFKHNKSSEIKEKSLKLKVSETLTETDNE